MPFSFVPVEKKHTVDDVNDVNRVEPLHLLF